MGLRFGPPHGTTSAAVTTNKNMKVNSFTKRFILPFTIRRLFYTSTDHRRYKLWCCQNFSDALSYILDNIYIRYGTNLNRQIVCIPKGTNCAPLVANLFLFCYKRDFMTSLSDDNQADIIEAFNSISRYLDDP